MEQHQLPGEKMYSHPVNLDPNTHNVKLADSGQLNALGRELYYYNLLVPKNKLSDPEIKAYAFKLRETFPAMHPLSLKVVIDGLISEKFEFDPFSGIQNLVRAYKELKKFECVVERVCDSAKAVKRWWEIEEKYISPEFKILLETLSPNRRQRMIM